MSSSGMIPLAEIWAMLDGCAVGHQRKQREHNWLITHNGRSFPGLPVGPHGARKNVNIQVGHVKKMIRILGIAECAKKKIPRLA
jgi:hypothetical protein